MFDSFEKNEVKDYHSQLDQKFIKFVMDDNFGNKGTEIEQEFNELRVNSEELKEAVSSVFDILINELTLEIIFETHRAAKLGLYGIDEDSNNDEQFAANTTTEETSKKSQDCVCPNCSRTIAAIKFAPHLEQCMGMSRKSSRNATRLLLLNNNGKDRKSSYTEMASDNEDDADWSTGDKRKRKKAANPRIKKAKNSPRKSDGILTYDTMPDEEKKSFLEKYCGVVSEHTKKICSRSLKCNLHSEEKRKAVRSKVFGDTTETTELMNVDIEGDDDLDSASLKDLLQDNSNTSSPADSASNSNSSSSFKKREKTAKVKKNVKKDRSSPNID